MPRITIRLAAMRNRQPHFEIKKSPTFNSRGGEIGHQWYFNIVAANGKILAHSENYKRRRSARGACRAINPLLRVVG